MRRCWPMLIVLVLDRSVGAGLLYLWVRWLMLLWRSVFGRRRRRRCGLRGVVSVMPSCLLG